MKTKTTEIYICDHCKKWYQRKWLCEKHEKRCSYNPDNQRACFGCVYVEMKNETIGSGISNTLTGEEEEMNVQVLFCSKKQHYIYPPKAEHKGNAFDMGDYENLPMPKECELQKLVGIEFDIF